MGNRVKLAIAAACAALVVACGGGGGGGPSGGSLPLGGTTGGTTAASGGTSTGSNSGSGAGQELGGSPVTGTPVRLTELAIGFATPWSLAFLPDGRLLVTERGAATLHLVSASGQRIARIGGVPPVASIHGQAGLLDVVVDPAFATNRRIFFTFAEADAADPNLNGTAVARAELDLEARQLRNVQVIFRQLPKVASLQQFGARLALDRNGHLFVTLGERYLATERDYAQDLTRGHGKIMRITADGAPAPGNPAWTAAGAQPTIWSLGHRNPQGAAVHPVTGELWISEHGPQGGDEINRILPGRNYGWPLVSRGQVYDTLDPWGVPSMAGMEDPAWAWLTIDGTPWTGGEMSSTAPAGMTFYDSAAVPEWRGNLFVAALAGRSLWRLVLEGNTVVGQQRLLADQNQRLRDVKVGPDGALYILTDFGQLLRYGP
jgi:glucose/arabinose dehydrogenase